MYSHVQKLAPLKPIQDEQFCSILPYLKSATHIPQSWNLAVIPCLKWSKKCINHVIHSLFSARMMFFYRILKIFVDLEI